MPKVSRSNASQAPQNLPSRKEARANGTLNPDAPLTEMQLAFVTNLVDNAMTQTAAARVAGFSGPGQAANTLMQHPKIQQAIAERRAAYAAASQVTKKMVIDGFLEAINVAKLQADSLGMISGWREVGKMCGFYEATKVKIDVTHKGEVLLQRMSVMSDEELLRLAEEEDAHELIEGEFTKLPSTEGQDGVQSQ